MKEMKIEKKKRQQKIRYLCKLRRIERTIKSKNEEEK